MLQIPPATSLPTTKIPFVEVATSVDLATGKTQLVGNDLLTRTGAKEMRSNHPLDPQARRSNGKSRTPGLTHTLLGQRRINLAGDDTGPVSLALTMTDQSEPTHRSLMERHDSPLIKGRYSYSDKINVGLSRASGRRP
jgi:hypothetical protein